MRTYLCPMFLLLLCSVLTCPVEVDIDTCTLYTCGEKKKRRREHVIEWGKCILPSTPPSSLVRLGRPSVLCFHVETMMSRTVDSNSEYIYFSPSPRHPVMLCVAFKCACAHRSLACRWVLSRLASQFFVDASTNSASVVDVHFSIVDEERLLAAPCGPAKPTPGALPACHILRRAGTCVKSTEIYHLHVQSSDRWRAHLVTLDIAWSGEPVPGFRLSFAQLSSLPCVKGLQGCLCACGRVIYYNKAVPSGGIYMWRRSRRHAYLTHSYEG